MKSRDNKANRLSVAFLAGTLGQGGAEKQLFYMVRALQEAGVIVLVYSLTKGEYYEKKLEEIGCPPKFIGKHSLPINRLQAILMQTIKDKPDILQSMHFFGNLYITIVGIITRRLTVGAIRSNTVAELKANKFWGYPLLIGPSFMITNSSIAKQNADRIRKKPTKVLHNVIDLTDFTKQVQIPQNHIKDRVFVATIARLEKNKNIDDFLKALALSREYNQQIMGIIIGDGPERDQLEELANELNLLPDGVQFLGKHANIPTLLPQFDIFVLTSQYEGFPNVILEAMAASLPVITTPVGETVTIIEDGVTGFLVPHDAPDAIASHILELARSQKIRKEIGSRGREKVTKFYNSDQLADKLLEIYKEFARVQGNQRVFSLLNG